MGSLKDQYPEELMVYCRQWARALGALRSADERMDYIRRELPVFLRDRSICRMLLEKIAAGKPYPDVRGATTFDNEIHLYTDARRLFSLHMYLYGPGEFSPIHDHNSWGVIGTPSGVLGVSRYDRLDGTDQIILREDRCLEACSVDVTLPLDAGIHRTGSPTGRTIVMISLYGTPIRRLYVNGFRPGPGGVYRLNPPRLKKKMLARRALESMIL